MDVVFFLVVGAVAALAFILGYRAQKLVERHDLRDPYTRYRNALRDDAELDLDAMLQKERTLK